ncbi:MAG: transglycosylase domain-containing protein [Clostridioides sp.]|jgi:membrane peptidoglycan carboxypeptidase|nr:transglycosylase domain-containing protein [Clostridioides sp.]
MGFDSDDNKIRRKKVSRSKPESEGMTKKVNRPESSLKRNKDKSTRTSGKKPQTSSKQPQTLSKPQHVRSKQDDMVSRPNRSSTAAIRASKKKRRKKQLRNKIIKWTLGSVLAVALIFSLIGVGYTMYAIHGTPKVTKELVHSRYLSSEEVSIDSMPNDLKNAIVSIEDERFYKHGGVDMKSLLRSAVYTLTSDKTQGGSTIDMQVSKNLLTDEEKTMKRKVRDIYNSIQLNKVMTKSEILETYLNNIYLGQSTYGVAKGANVYFGKNVKDLSLAECAMLAGITNNPYRYGIYSEGKKRQELVLYKMRELGYINEEQYLSAKRADIHYKSEID